MGISGPRKGPSHTFHHDLDLGICPRKSVFRTKFSGGGGWTSGCLGVGTEAGSFLAPPALPNQNGRRRPGAAPARPHAFSSASAPVCRPAVGMWGVVPGSSQPRSAQVAVDRKTQFQKTEGKEHLCLAQGAPTPIRAHRAST